MHGGGRAEGPSHRLQEVNCVICSGITFSFAIRPLQILLNKTHTQEAENVDTRHAKVP